MTFRGYYECRGSECVVMWFRTDEVGRKAQVARTRQESALELSITSITCLSRNPLICCPLHSLDYIRLCSNLGQSFDRSRSLCHTF
jgi:hypothetical protein